MKLEKGQKIYDVKCYSCKDDFKAIYNETNICPRCLRRNGVEPKNEVKIGEKNGFKSE